MKKVEVKTGEEKLGVPKRRLLHISRVDTSEWVTPPRYGMTPDIAGTKSQVERWEVVKCGGSKLTVATSTSVPLPQYRLYRKPNGRYVAVDKKLMILLDL